MDDVAIYCLILFAATFFGGTFCAVGAWYIAKE